MIEDEIGNKLYRKKDTIYLKLLSEKFSRNLGFIDEQAKNFITHRVYEKHLYRNAQAFGFNSEFLRSATLFKHVKLITDRLETFMIPVDFIFKNGDYLHFKKQGFERQIFVKLEQLEKFRV